MISSSSSSHPRPSAATAAAAAAAAAAAMVDSVRSKQASPYAIALQQTDQICLCVRDPAEDSVERLSQRGRLTQCGASSINSNRGGCASAIGEGSAVRSTDRQPIGKKESCTSCDIPTHLQHALV
jgi:hypothetical protein